MFDSFSASFDQKLAQFDYQAPALVAAALNAAPGVLRSEGGQPVNGWIATLRHAPG